MRRMGNHPQPPVLRISMAASKIDQDLSIFVQLGIDPRVQPTTSAAAAPNSCDHGSSLQSDSMTDSQCLNTGPPWLWRPSRDSNVDDTLEALLALRNIEIPQPLEQNSELRNPPGPSKMEQLMNGVLPEVPEPAHGPSARPTTFQKLFLEPDETQIAFPEEVRKLGRQPPPPSMTIPGIATPMRKRCRKEHEKNQDATL